MKIKKYLTLFLSFVNITSFAASPADGDNLFVWTKGAKTAVVYSLENLDKMTFEDNTFSVWTNNGKTDFAYDSIDLLTFRDEVKPVTGVELLTKLEFKVRISYDREVQLLSVESEKPISSIIVCDLQGRMVVCQSKTENCLQLSLSGLPLGVYIVKVKGVGIDKSVKIIK